MVSVKGTRTITSLNTRINIETRTDIGPRKTKIAISTATVAAARARIKIKTGTRTSIVKKTGIGMKKGIKTRSIRAHRILAAKTKTRLD